jgi:hypothetical protein
MSNGSNVVYWTRNIGHVLIDYVNIEIGGQEIKNLSLAALPEMVVKC